jgi:hypothetical protein
MGPLVVLALVALPQEPVGGEPIIGPLWQQGLS